MKDYRPIIGITMGDPVGIGPKIVMTALREPAIYKACRPLVIGDAQRLEAAKKYTGSRLNEPLMGHMGHELDGIVIQWGHWRHEIVATPMGT